MHEAALAGTIAIQLREARAAGVVGRPRLSVRGGHDEPFDFDAAIRLHLTLVAPELRGETLEIVHVPVARLCSGCLQPFDAAQPAAVCPTCGAVALPSRMTEEVELDWVDGTAV